MIAWSRTSNHPAFWTRQLIQSDVPSLDSRGRYAPPTRGIHDILGDRTVTCEAVPVSASLLYVSPHALRD